MFSVYVVCAFVFLYNYSTMPESVTVLKKLTDQLPFRPVKSLFPYFPLRLTQFIYIRISYNNYFYYLSFFFIVFFVLLFLFFIFIFFYIYLFIYLFNVCVCVRVCVRAY